MGILAPEICVEAMRLLDDYVGKLKSFHDSQAPFLAGMGPATPGFETAKKETESARLDLFRARQKYWQHARMHGCRQMRGAEDSLKPLK